jgi:hypothetical protein
VGEEEGQGSEDGRTGAEGREEAEEGGGHHELWGLDLIYDCSFRFGMN